MNSPLTSPAVPSVSLHAWFVRWVFSGRTVVVLWSVASGILQMNNDLKMNKQCVIL